MNYPNYAQVTTASRLVEISRILDEYPANASRTPLEQLLLRTSVKVSEEGGEVGTALIGYTGQNPRKGITHSLSDVVTELADNAITAVGAMEHITGNRGEAIKILEARIRYVHARLLGQDTMALGADVRLMIHAALVNSGKADPAEGIDY